MSRYFFKIHGTYPFIDETGVELATDAVAWTEAKRFVRDIETFLEPGEAWSLEVSKENQPLYLLMISSSRFEARKG